MATAQQSNQKPSSIRTYINALFVIILIGTSGTAAFLLWIDFQSQQTIQTTNKFHMATIVHANNINHDLQQIESLLLREEILDEAHAAGETAHSSRKIAVHLARMEMNLGYLIKLEKRYEGKESDEFISGIISKKFNQFKSSVEGIQPGASLDHNLIHNISKPMRIALLQLESLHLAVNSENLEAYSHYKGKFIKNFLALILTVLIAGVFVAAKAFSRMNKILRESEEFNY